MAVKIELDGDSLKRRMDGQKVFRRRACVYEGFMPENGVCEIYASGKNRCGQRWASGSTSSYLPRVDFIDRKSSDPVLILNKKACWHVRL